MAYTIATLKISALLGLMVILCATPGPVMGQPCPDNSGRGCYWGGYCSLLVVRERYYFPSCVDGRCRCQGANYFDECTCLPHVSSCLIERDANSSVGTPSSDGRSQTTYSCIATGNYNCVYEVHVIGNYESSNGRHGHGVEREAGDTSVQLNVIGQSSRPLILVLTSLQPVNWQLSVSSGVVVDRVILGGHYYDESTVTYSPGQVASLEVVTRDSLSYGYGSNDETAENILYLTERFGPISSFSGSYSADSWVLNIDRSPGFTTCPPLTESTEQLECESLVPPTNGMMTTPIATPYLDPVATYTCNEGYRREGNITRTCRGGTWSGQAPVCILISCPPLSHPTNGRVSVTGTTYRSTATYTCSAGYSVAGTSSRMCRYDSSWSGDTPYCTPACHSDSVRRCYSGGYCSSFYILRRSYKLSCVEGQCRCQGIPYYDDCTCLPHVSSCLIEKDANSSVGVPTTDGRSEQTYSCVASDQYNHDYEVHVIGNYESSNGRHGHGVAREAGDTSVQLNVIGQSPRPLILVLTSYEPVNWQLSVSSGVVVDRVILGGYYNSTVTYSPGHVSKVEVVARDSLSYGYGTDTGGGDTVDNLLYLTNRFGPVTSFSGSYRADSWVLDIFRSPVECDPLASPTNGVVNSSSATQHSVATYTCNVGYQLEGTASRTCQDGTWSGQAPVCRLITCPPLSHPTNGRVNYADTSYNSLATYSCNAGFRLSGGTSQRCQADGSWSGQAPVCNAGCPSDSIRRCFLGGYCSYFNVLGRLYRIPCVEGQCRCQGIPQYDDCTCLPHVSSCLIERDTNSSVGTPSSDGRSQTTYSCIATENYNCAYEVHVIGNYESSNGRHGHGVEREAGNTSVQLNVIGQSSRPLILVLTSYEPVNWQLSVSSGVVIDRVTLGGYYESTATYSPGQVASLEVVARDSLSSGYGTDTGGGDTVDNLLYLTNRFGPVTSFSGSYRADSWVLDIDRSSGSTSTTCAPPSESSKMFECESLVPPTNGMMTTPIATPYLDPVATYTCNEGYRRDGVATRTCRNGTWSGQAPVCTFINCSSLSHPTNGRVSVTGTTYRSTATYTCSAGYSVAGTSSRACRYDSSWSGDTPYCTPACHSDSVRRCYSGGYCSSFYILGRSYKLSCVEGQCRCQGIPYYDDCTCLPHVSSCLIEKDANSSVGIPTTDGRSEQTYSCIASDQYNHDYEVHVIGNYESSNGRHGHGVAREAGDTSVQLNVIGQSSRPLILVLTSYDPVNWQLSVSSGVVVDRVILGGYYNSTVTYSPGHVSNVEVVARDSLSSGYGTDTGGGDTVDNLLYLTNRFGPVTSFSGSYRADSWVLDIVRSPVECDPLASPTNGVVNSSSTTQHSVATYTCNVGYQLEGTASRTCQDGTWSGQAPVCRLITCPPLSHPTNGRVNYADTSYNSLATYSCNAGFRLSGGTSQRCQADGSWSGQAPVCNAGCPSNSIRRCSFGRYCSTFSVLGRYYTVPCVEGQCRCQGIPYYDDCTCLPHISSCLIERDANSSVGTPSTDGDSETTYSCIAIGTYNCAYEVHVIGNYESSNGRHGFGVEREAGNTSVQLNVIGQSSRPLILVLTSYEPVNWQLSVSTGVLVILGGYYESTVTYSPGQVASLEVVERDILKSGYGTDIGGGHTVDSLLYLTERFGPISSFSGSYRADHWVLNIDRSSGSTTCAPPTMKLECDPLVPPTNGMVTIPIATQYSVAMYTCNEGYRRDGVASRTCRDGTWSGQAPVCTFISCPRLSHPTNGQVNYTDTIYRLTATYSCDAGYSLIGTSSRTCRYDSSWSGDTPYCTPACLNDSVSRCYFGGYCSYFSVHGRYYTATCVEGQCRCQGIPYYDDCTCLPHISTCLMERDTNSSVGTPSTRGDSETTYSCVAIGTYNCAYEVHVIGNYESSNGRHGYGIDREAGDTSVQLNVIGQSSRPLILVLTSYEPVNWQLSVSSGVVIDRVILGGYYESTVTYSPGQVSNVEVVARDSLSYGYGTDTGGGHTVENILYLTGRFGLISSFTGSYRADSWVLDIDSPPGCTRG